MRLFFVLIVFFSVSYFSGCENAPQSKKEAAVKEAVIKPDHPVAEQEKLDQSQFKPFYIFTDKGSRQNHYTPSGFMGDVSCIKLNDRWMEECHSGKTCMQVDYDIACSKEGQKWGGIYWLHPPNNWGQRKGGYSLSGASKLTFWARGAIGGEQIQEFTVGGIAGNYPDTDIAVIGPVILTKEWRKYSIDLRGKDLSYISGGFAWTTSEDVNFDGCKFYLDEIKFE